MQQLAEMGFSVVQIDGMGTMNDRRHSRRGVENVCDAGSPSDLWTGAARRSSYDVTRVGSTADRPAVRNALAACSPFGLHKVAVSYAGCHGQRWTRSEERQWMGAVGDQYALRPTSTRRPAAGEGAARRGERHNVDPASTIAGGRV